MTDDRIMELEARVAELEAAGDALADAADALDIRPADAAPVDAAIAVWRDVRLTCPHRLT